MRKVSIIILLLILLAESPEASVTKNYLHYNLKISRITFRELLLVEQANLIFNLWTNNEMTRGDALKELNDVKSKVDENIDLLREIKSPAILTRLHDVYTHSIEILKSSILNHLSFIESNDLKSPDIREKLEKHLINYIDNIYECQISNVNAQLEFQKSLDVRSESENLRDYFKWNNQIIPIMVTQYQISRDMEKMMVRLSLGAIDLIEAQKNEQKLNAEAKSLKKKIDSIKTSSGLQELQKKFSACYDNYLDFHMGLTSYLEMPTREKSAQMQEKSKIANKVNFEFNEACFEFLEKHSAEGD